VRRLYLHLIVPDVYKIIRPFGTFWVMQPLIFKTVKMSTVTKLSANCALDVKLVILYIKLVNYRASAPESFNLGLCMNIRLD
jgi:hypothetical protein